MIMTMAVTITQTVPPSTTFTLPGQGLRDYSLPFVTVTMTVTKHVTWQTGEKKKPKTEMPEEVSAYCMRLCFLSVLCPLLLHICLLKAHMLPILVRYAPLRLG